MASIVISNRARKKLESILEPGENYIDRWRGILPGSVSTKNIAGYCCSKGYFFEWTEKYFIIYVPYDQPTGDVTMKTEITEEDLQMTVDRINRAAGFDPAYIESGTIYTYSLDYSDDGVNLVQSVSASGYIKRDITPNAGKKETYNLMQAFLAGMEAAA